MEKKMKLKFLLLFSCICLYTFPVAAQSFNLEKRADTAENATEKSQQKQNLDMTPEEEQEVLKRLQERLNPRVKDGNLVINPVDLGATGDGSPRGTAAFISTDSDANEDDSNIYLFYSDFKISRTAATGIGCRVRFHVLNGLNNRISNISIKLVWPGLNTPVSFNNVNPNTENYFDYALFGDGCYQMDKIPNIVVNRCRVKGMSQEACANKIRWLSKR